MVFILGKAVNADLQDLVGENESKVDRSAREQARLFLRALLDHESQEQTRLVLLAQQNGISWSTVRRAALDLAIESRFEGAYGSQKWIWHKPQVWPDL